MRDHRLTLSVAALFITALPLFGWQILNPSPLAGNINSITVTSPDTCWVADNYGGISVTTDGGDSWRSVHLPDFVWGKHFVSFENSAEGWVAEPLEMGGVRCYHTTTGGDSWAEFSFGTENPLFELHCFSSDGATVIAAGYDISNETPAIFRFVEGQFTRVALPPGNSGAATDIFILNGRSVWVCGERGYFAFSANGGQSWQSAATGVNVTLSAVGFVSNMIGWVGGGQFNTPVLLKTSNGGGSWTPVENVDASSPIIGIAPFRQAGAIVVSKGSGVDSRATVLKTEDGASWSTISSVQNELFATVDVVGDEIWASGQSGFLMRAVDGQNLEPVGGRVTSSILTDVSFATPQDGWAIGEQSTILKTTDGGDSWIPIQNFPGWGGTHILAITDDRIIAICTDSREYLTVDGGGHWVEISISDLNVTHFRRYADKLIAVAGGNIYLSANDGDNWTEKHVSDTTVVDITMAGNTILAALDQGEVKRSSDNGDSWSTANQIPTNCTAIAHFDALNGWAIGTDGGIDRLYATRNGWETYASFSGFLSVFDYEFVSETEGWIAGTFNTRNGLREGVMHLSDHGSRQALLDLPVGRITGVASIDPAHVWLCGAGGVIAKLTEEAGGVWEKPTPNPFDIRLANAFPNPTNGRITIELNTRASRPLLFDLISINGRSSRVYRVPTESTRFGIEMNDLPAGTYYLKERSLSDQLMPIVLVK